MAGAGRQMGRRARRAGGATIVQAAPRRGGLMAVVTGGTVRRGGLRMAGVTGGTVRRGGLRMAGVTAPTVRRGGLRMAVVTEGTGQVALLVRARGPMAHGPDAGQAIPVATRDPATAHGLRARTAMPSACTSPTASKPGS